MRTPAFSSHHITPPSTLKPPTDPTIQVKLCLCQMWGRQLYQMFLNWIFHPQVLHVSQIWTKHSQLLEVAQLFHVKGSQHSDWGRLKKSAHHHRHYSELSESYYFSDNVRIISHWAATVGDYLATQTWLNIARSCTNVQLQTPKF